MRVVSMQLAFYGFISNNPEDAIALDNIYIGQDDSTTTTADVTDESSSVSDTTSTASTTSIPSPGI